VSAGRRCPHCGGDLSRPKVSLTERQRKLLEYIAAHRDRHGEAPSLEEMREAMGRRSTSGVHAMLDRLEERGHIARMRGRVRAIEIIAA
jgi:repressor LexA